MENKDMPAYPQSVAANENGIYLAVDANVSDKSHVIGLSKREAFAMAAMQGLCANPDYRTWSDEFVTAMAVGQADRILAELSKPQP